MSVSLELDGTQFQDAGVGGLNTPQFSQLDLDLDGDLDLVAFDRNGYVFRTFIRSNGSYEYAPEFESQLPKANGFALLANFMTCSATT